MRLGLGVLLRLCDGLWLVLAEHRFFEVVDVVLDGWWLRVCEAVACRFGRGVYFGRQVVEYRREHVGVARRSTLQLLAKPPRALGAPRSGSVQHFFFSNGSFDFFSASLLRIESLWRVLATAVDFHHEFSCSSHRVLKHRRYSRPEPTQKRHPLGEQNTSHERARTTGGTAAAFSSGAVVGPCRLGA